MDHSDLSAASPAPDRAVPPGLGDPGPRLARADHGRRAGLVLSIITATTAVAALDGGVLLTWSGLGSTAGVALASGLCCALAWAGRRRLAGARLRTARSAAVDAATGSTAALLAAVEARRLDPVDATVALAPGVPAPEHQLLAWPAWVASAARASGGRVDLAGGSPVIHVPEAARLDDDQRRLLGLARSSGEASVPLDVAAARPGVTSVVAELRSRQADWVRPSSVVRPLAGVAVTVLGLVVVAVLLSAGTAPADDPATWLAATGAAGVAGAGAGTALPVRSRGVRHERLDDLELLLALRRDLAESDGSTAPAADAGDQVPLPATAPWALALGLASTPRGRHLVGWGEDVQRALERTAIEVLRRPAGAPSRAARPDRP